MADPVAQVAVDQPIVADPDVSSKLFRVLSALSLKVPLTLAIKLISESDSGLGDEE